MSWFRRKKPEDKVEWKPPHLRGPVIHGGVPHDLFLTPHRHCLLRAWESPSDRGYKLRLEEDLAHGLGERFFAEDDPVNMYFGTIAINPKKPEAKAWKFPFTRGE
jgi:hypothetical protein